jgi:MOSC domain-containing protein YiiM
MIAEACEQCRFAAGEYTRQDLRGTLASLGRRWEWLIEGLVPSVLAARPEPRTWSAVEYAAHTRDVTAVIELGVRTMLDEDRPVFPALSAVDASADDPPSRLDPASVVGQLTAAADRLQRRVSGLTEGAWERQAVIGDDVRDVASLVAHAVHDAEHHLQDVGRGLRRIGVGAPTAIGVVAQVNASDGGVPKRPRSGPVAVGRRGLAGDRQRNRRHHGRPSQALCLWSLDVIGGLAAEGHPIGPGCAGENVTVAGLDWRTARPGVRLQLGTALVEVSGYADPCANNARWFADRDVDRIAHDRHPGRSRVYAAVLADGVVAAGDAVVVEPER